ncbi:WcaF family extracellular polysaccharide biosynthesis acetyltransferase [Mucilaginibacter sp. cycad4]|uniref:WcaF family extracellular polysaccharide biosynthesis acetyltransferase n=1 Tax=Mucilaginibacter sp. cycad4 TaxID=3342096 RepID=UPI002AAAA311|nr:WcaF family extracellular polysaccharide biosynthesis acetyltransferase [Mucilaginibacter gossypii]WPV00230.1 WcaF family extracellular polysaccharide biosynthesis acetyltransferase [Mucilaginibacter gossypii]
MISKVRLKDFDNSVGLDRGAGKLKNITWYLVKMVFFLNAFPFPNSLKCFLLRSFGARVGTGVVIKPRVNIHMPWKLEVGSDVWIGEEAFILNFEKINIGNNVCVSQRAFLCGGNHDFRTPSMPYRNGPITLADGSWVGAGVFVGPGVTIGTDTVVTAGSVVTSNLGDNGIYKGNPPVYVKPRWPQLS